MSAAISSHELHLARVLLELSPLAGLDDARSAFRSKVKVARPDQGGSEDQYRALIWAYRLLQKAEAAARSPAPPTEPPLGPETAAHTPRPTPPNLPFFDITVDEAMGGVVRKRPSGDVLVLPAGLRRGDQVRLSVNDHGPWEARLHEIRILGQAQCTIIGNDLWQSLKVAPRLLQNGGRLWVKTPRGQVAVWVPRAQSLTELGTSAMTSPPLDPATPDPWDPFLTLCPLKDGSATSPDPDQDGAKQNETRIELQGHGLPARGPHPQGDLILRLSACAAATVPSPADRRRMDFVRAWLHGAANYAEA